MDFGKILDSWHEGEEEDRRRRLERLMERYGPDAEDARRREAEASGKPGSPGSPRLVAIDDSIDLHGMTAAQAEAALGGFLDACARQGRRKVLIIHGKGLHSERGAVLHDVVRRVLEQHRHAGRSGRADAKDGGSGATWVLIRPPRRRSVDAGTD